MLLFVSYLLFPFCRSSLIFLMASQRQYQQNQMDSVLRNTSCGMYNLYTQIRTVIKTCASEEEPEPCWASLLTTLLDIKMTNFGSWKLPITTLDDVNVITNIITIWNHIAVWLNIYVYAFHYILAKLHAIIIILYNVQDF